MTQSAPAQAMPLQTIREVKPLSFIFEKPHALAIDICNEIIRRFEATPDDQYPGRIGQTAEEEFSIKRSTDLVVSGKEHWKDIDTELFRSLGLAIQEFRDAYPFFRGPFKDSGYAVQRTRPGEFYHWHIDGGSHEFAERQLVAVWYLSDVPAPGGATEFSYQDVRIQPEAGKLLLFPPFWTHEHRGTEVRQGIKYIATTWVVFG